MHPQMSVNISQYLPSTSGMPKPHYKYFAWLVQWIPIITRILQIRKLRHSEAGDLPKVAQLEWQSGFAGPGG